MIPPLTPRERQIYDSIVAAVSRETGVSAEDIAGISRDVCVTLARRMAAWRLKEAGLTYSAIAREFGGRHHSAIAYLVATFDPKATVICAPDGEVVETPAEARARVDRDIAAGLRCPACHLLIPV